VVGNKSSAVIGAVMFYKKLALADELLKHAIFPKELQEKMKRESILN